MTSLQKICATAVAAVCVIVTGCSKSTSVAQNTGTSSTATTSGQPADTSAQPAASTSAPATTYVSGTPSDGNLAPVTNASYQEPATSQGSDSYPEYYSDEASVYAPQPPPELPEYTQPACPGEGQIWTPGYWNYTTTGYFWVPGVWVLAPYVGALWTPPYWAFESGRYRLHRGFWAPHVGFYGGINYGFGYVGHGYYGGYWRDNNLYYNRAVTNVNVAIVRNVYDYHVSTTNIRIAYVGGNGGLHARPTAAELAVVHEQIRPPIAAQVQHMNEAARDRALFAAVNHGRPAAPVMARPLDVGYRAPAPRPAGLEARGVPPNHPEPNRMEPNRVEPNRQAPNAAPQARPMTEGRQVPEARPGEPARSMEQGRPGAEPRGAQPRVEQRPAPQTANRPAPQMEQRPAPRTEQRPTPEPRTEGRPAPAPNTRPEARPPAATPHVEARPQPAPRAEPRSAPAAHEAHPEAHPGPAPHPPQGHPDEKKPPEHR